MFRWVRGQGFVGLSLRVQWFRGLALWGLVCRLRVSGVQGFRDLSVLAKELGVLGFRSLMAWWLYQRIISGFRIWWVQFRGLGFGGLVVTNVLSLGLRLGIQGIQYLQGLAVLGFQRFSVWVLDRVQGLGFRFKVYQGLVGFRVEGGLGLVVQ